MGLPALQPDEAQTTYYSAEDYLALEHGADTKHEYAYGQVWAMAGAEPAHNEINYNLNQFIGPVLRQRGCKGYMGDQRVASKTSSGYLYPDTVVACGPVFSEAQKPRSLTNPVFIAEVTSGTTANRDHYDKFMLYRQVESLRQYLMLSSETVHAELYTLNEQSHWVLSETRDLSAVLDLSSIGCQVPMAEIYRDVEVAAQP